MTSIDDVLLDNVRRWFERTKGGSLRLPGGWFGRPHDNQHILTWSCIRPNRLILELDNQQIMIFDGPASVTESSNGLVIADFEQLVFVWREYGEDGRSHSDVYAGGKVHFS